MRTGLIAGLVVAGVVALLNFGQVLTNADFIYMCAGGALLDGVRGGQAILPVCPYFPPGYPCLLWAMVHAGLLAWPGMTALHAGTLLSALGAGLAAGALACGARLMRIPPGPALLLGLLGVSLPDMAEIAFNPHVDALFTGLALCLIVATLAVLDVAALLNSARGRSAGAPLQEARRNIAAPLIIAICGGILLTLRWHAVLVVAPCLLALLLSRGQTPAPDKGLGARLLPAQRKTRPAPRQVGLALLCLSLLAAGWSYWGLWVTAGSLQSAAPLQVATGAVYRQYGAGREQQAVAEVFSDYASWASHAQPVTRELLLDAERANLPLFLTRKAVLGGVGLCLLLALLYRRWPPQAHWLLLFIAGYSAAVATTYFTPRASSLVELCALLLAASALHLPFTQNEHELRRQKLDKRRLHFKPNAPSLRLDPALLGGVLALALLAGIGYNAWRVQHDLRSQWQTQYAERTAVYAQALELAGDDAGAIYGRFDFLPPRAHMPWCLPGPSYTRLWLDDPRVAGLVGELLPEVKLGDTTDPSSLQLLPDTIRAVLLWPALDGPHAEQLAQHFDSWQGVWEPKMSDRAGARIWWRTPVLGRIPRKYNTQ